MQIIKLLLTLSSDMKNTRGVYPFSEEGNSQQ